MKETLIEAIGWAGQFGSFMNCMSFHIDLLSPQDSDEATDQVRDAFGTLMIKLLDLAFGSGRDELLACKSTDAIMAKFMKTIDSERLALLVRPRAIRRSTRRMSALRESGRRISDASFWSPVQFQLDELEEL